MSSGFEIFPEVSGSLTERSPTDLIVLIERKRITGVLEAHDGPSRFELVLVGGEVKHVETTVECDDPLEGFLGLEKGRYRLRQQVLLPDGDVSDQRVAIGSLEDHGPIDLVQSCELGGLHGTLRIKSGGRIVEALFDAGVLTTITLDGHQDVDVNDVWGWKQGEWAILALPALEPPPDPCDSGMDFLRDFEVAAVSFLSDAAQKAEASWHTGDSVEAPVAGARAVTSLESKAAAQLEVPERLEVCESSDAIARPAKRPDERTVRVVYYDTAKPTEDPTPLPSRYSDADVTSTFVYKRPKQRIIVENSSCVERSSRPLIDDVVPLADTAGSSKVELDDQDPIELAFAPAVRKRERPLPKRRPSVPAPVRRRRSSPWPLFIILVVLLGLIGVALYLITNYSG